MYNVSSSMWLPRSVCCVFFHRERTPEELAPTVAAFQFPLSQYYCYWVPATKASGRDAHQSPVRPSLISSVRLIRCTVHYPVCASYKCTAHQSPVCASSSPFTNLHCAHSTSAPFTNLQLRFYKSCTNLHCCASTVAPI